MCHLPIDEAECNRIQSSSEELAFQEMALHDDPALFDTAEVVVGKQLGRGGFCTVHQVDSFQPSEVNARKLTTSQVAARAVLAFNASNAPRNESRYAVKFPRPDLVSNPKKLCAAIKDIQRESRILSVLNHENIVKLRGCAIPGQEGQFFIIMDRLDGTLLHLVEKWRFQAEKLKEPRPALFGIQLQHAVLVDRLQVATEIASAIEYLHGKRMIYRDIKAGNVGITASGHAQLFDFGLCRFLPDVSLAFEDNTYPMSGKVGTYRFMAPEIADAKPYNQLADTYSYVHVLYQILSLEKPYPTLSKQEHRKRVIDGGERPPIDSQWPITIQELFYKGWSVNISDRPSMSEVVAILKDTIADFDQDKPISAALVKLLEAMNEAVSQVTSDQSYAVESDVPLATAATFESQDYTPEEACLVDPPPSPSRPKAFSFAGFQYLSLKLLGNGKRQGGRHGHASSGEVT
jgi:serine/threonine protein kinase